MVASLIHMALLYSIAVKAQCRKPAKSTCLAKQADGEVILEVQRL